MGACNHYLNRACHAGENELKRQYAKGSVPREIPVDVFLLDTGVRPPPPTSTEDIDLCVVEYRSFLQDDEQNVYDDNGHGTHVASILGAAGIVEPSVVGVAPRVRIHSYKVMNRTGQATMSAVLSALQQVKIWKAIHPTKPCVVNMSFGAKVGTASYNDLDRSVADCVARGIVVCVAAGNSLQNCSTYSPQHVTEALTVGGYDANNNFAYFSNYGPDVSFLLPATAIKGLWPVSLAGVATGMSTKVLSGTSMACPFLTGAVALYLAQYPTHAPAQVLQNLKTIAANVSRPADTPNPLVGYVPTHTTPLSLYIPRTKFFVAKS
jgi:subtilisin family serine protease